MKFRNGFVSNSSSSSFIIALNCQDIPQTTKELCDALNLSEKSIRVDVAEYILQQIKHRITSKEEFKKIALENLENRAYYEIWRRNDRKRIELYNNITISPQDREKLIRELDTNNDEAAKELAEQMYIPENFEEKFNLEDHCVVCIELSDNDGEVGCEAEHGSQFRKVTYESFSNH